MLLAPRLSCLPGDGSACPLSPSSGLHRGPTHRLIKSPDGQSVSLGEIEGMRIGLEARRLAPAALGLLAQEPWQPSSRAITDSLLSRTLRERRDKSRILSKASFSPQLCRV